MLANVGMHRRVLLLITFNGWTTEDGRITFDDATEDDEKPDDADLAARSPAGAGTWAL